MRNLNKQLQNRSIDVSNLIKYGFYKDNDKYIYKTSICDKQFEVIVCISNNENISKLIDIVNDEEYILVDIENASGEFVGKIKEEYERVLQDIISKCTIQSVFKNNQSKEIINYVKTKYNDDLEFLWDKFDDVAVLRNKTNDKWYAVLMKIEKNKLNNSSDDIIEVIDLKYQKEDINKIVDNKKIYPGYHMNKNNWITIILDGSVELEEIIKLIDNSYNLSKSKKVHKNSTHA